MKSPPSTKMSKSRGKKLVGLRGKKLVAATAKTKKTGSPKKASPKKLVEKKKKTMTHEEDGNRKSKRARK